MANNVPKLITNYLRNRIKKNEEDSAEKNDSLASDRSKAISTQSKRKTMSPSFDPSSLNFDVSSFFKYGQQKKNTSKQSLPNIMKKKQKLSKYQKKLKMIYLNPNLEKLYEMHRMVCPQAYMVHSVLPALMKGSLQSEKRAKKGEKTRKL